MDIKDLNLDNAELISTMYDVVLTSINYRNADQLLMSGSIKTIQEKFARLRSEAAYKKKLLGRDDVYHFTYIVTKRITLRIPAPEVCL